MHGFGGVPLPLHFEEEYKEFRGRGCWELYQIRSTKQFTTSSLDKIFNITQFDRVTLRTPPVPPTQRLQSSSSYSFILNIVNAPPHPPLRPQSSFLSPSNLLLKHPLPPSPPSQTTSTIGSCSSKTSSIPLYTSPYISPFYITTHSPRHYLALILPNHVCWTITAIYILPTLPRHAR
jgi:hypothetical protein